MSEDKPKPILKLDLMDFAIIQDARKKELIQAGLIQDLPERLPAENPLRQPINADNPPVKRNPIKVFWQFINANIVSAIVGGLIVGLILYVLLGH